jgi:hypothetical protein
LVLCEVLDAAGAPHACDMRAPLEAALTDAVRAEAPLFGLPGQWEFQVGPLPALELDDHVLLAL